MLYIHLLAVLSIKPFLFSRLNGVSTLGTLCAIVYLFTGVLIGFLKDDGDDPPMIYCTMAVFWCTVAAMIHSIICEYEARHHGRWANGIFKRIVDSRLYHMIFAIGGGEESARKAKRKGYLAPGKLAQEEYDGDDGDEMIVASAHDDDEEPMDHNIIKVDMGLNTKKRKERVTVLAPHVFNAPFESLESVEYPNNDEH